MKTYSLQSYAQSLLQLFYPRYCAGCHEALLETEECICSQCLLKLSATDFHLLKNNPVEKIFWGRTPVFRVVSCFYFSKGSVLQQLIHQIKYNGRQDAGYYLGRRMGHILSQDNSLRDINAIVPVPLHPAKEKLRGYNQATLLAKGIQQVLPATIYPDALKRTDFNETQTHKGRVARWQNVEHIFKLTGKYDLQHQHILLVDDVITTGATLEACAMELAQIPFIKISIATLAFTKD